MGRSDELRCEVCDIELAVGVACSSIGPMSIAYCKTCLGLRAEPLWALEGMDEELEHNARSEFYQTFTFYAGGYFPYVEVCRG